MKDETATEELAIVTVQQIQYDTEMLLTNADLHGNTTLKKIQWFKLCGK